MSSHVEIARRSTRGSLALFAGNALTAAFTALTLIILARLLGRDDYGVYTLAVLVPGILINFLGFGVNSGVTRFAAYHISRGETEVARRMTVNGLVFLSAFGLVLSASCYLGAGLFSTYLLHRPDAEGLVRFASLYLLSQCVFQSLVAALLGWSAMGRIGLASVSQSVVRVVATTGLVLLGFGTVGAIAGYSTSISLASLLSLVFLWVAMGGRAAGLSHLVQDIRTMLSYGVSLFVGQLAINMTAQYVVIVLAAFASNGDVGLYQSAYNVTAAITLASGAITQTLFPAFAHLHGSEGDTALAFKYATKYMGFVVSPIIFFLMASATPLTDVVYTSSYGAAAPYLVLLALSNISLVFGYGVLQSFFNGVNRTRLFMVFALTGVATQLALAPLLAIYAGLGIPGLIYSTLVSNLVATACGAALASRYLAARMDIRAAASVILASGVSYLAVFAVELLRAGDLAQLALDAAVFLLVYLTVAPAVGAVGAEDLDRLGVATSGLGALSRLFSVVIRYERRVLGVVSGLRP